MLVTYKPDNPDEPVWMMEEVVTTPQGQIISRIYWHVRVPLSGEIEEYPTREEASAAYWR